MKITAPKSARALHMHRYNMLQKAMDFYYNQNVHLYNNGVINLFLLAQWSLTAKLTPTERWTVHGKIMGWC